MKRDKSKTKLSSHITIENYHNLLNKQNKVKIAEFVFERLTERYVIPIAHVPKRYKSGFSIMANCCLLIETYQCFRKGLKDTRPRGVGEQVFGDFFDDEKEFILLKGMGKLFYQNVRCGILHQGETNNGWLISRKPADPIFDKQTLTLNANLFLNALAMTLENYRNELIREDWSATIWLKCRKKIQFIIDNC